MGTSHGQLEPWRLYRSQCIAVFTGTGSFAWMEQLRRSQYVPHVMRYYSGGSLFAGLFGNQQIVSVAMGQLGNSGGQKFWSWYGFDSRVEWCACFVSWCADQAGLIQSGAVPKFSLCTDGKNWFQEPRKMAGVGSMPSPGAIIFFDWDHDGTCDHVGIVERCDGTTVYTIEGNSGMR